MFSLSSDSKIQKPIVISNLYCKKCLTWVVVFIVKTCVNYNVIFSTFMLNIKYYLTVKATVLALKLKSPFVHQPAPFFMLLHIISCAAESFLIKLKTWFVSKIQSSIPFSFGVIYILTMSNCILVRALSFIWRCPESHLYT